MQLTIDSCESAILSHEERIKHLEARVDYLYQILGNIKNDLNAQSLSYVTPSNASSEPQSLLQTETFRCKATTSAGTQCSRNAQAGSEFCWQHAKSSSTSTSSSSQVTSESSTSKSYSTPSRQISTGPRGGQYYLNSSGKKTYVKRK